MNEYGNMLVEEQHYKAKLFQYPDWEQPSAVFDYEDIENDDVLLVLCANAKPDDEYRQSDTAFIWHGSDNDVEQEE